MSNAETPRHIIGHLHRHQVIIDPVKLIEPSHAHPNRDLAAAEAAERRRVFPLTPPPLIRPEEAAREANEQIEKAWSKRGKEKLQTRKKPHQHRSPDAVKAFGYVGKRFNERFAETEFQIRRETPGFPILSDSITGISRIQQMGEKYREDELEKIK